MANYFQKLLDTRWIEKSREIKERDNFICRNCSGKESILHVHHVEYISGLEPWDYPDDLLVTLCNKCHNRTHFIIELKKERLELENRITDKFDKNLSLLLDRLQQILDSQA